MSWSEPANWSNQKKWQSKYNKKPITVLNIGKLQKVQKDAGKQVVDGFSFEKVAQVFWSYHSVKSQKPKQYWITSNVKMKLALNEGFQ